MGICRQRRKQLRAARRGRLARVVDRVVPPGPGAPARLDALLAVGQLLLEALVQDPLQRGLGHAQVARAQALEEAAGPLVAQDLAHAVEAVAVPAAGGVAGALGDVLVELQARLDEPDGVGGGARRDAGDDGRAQVHPGGLAPAVEVVREQALAVAVDVEVDGARGDDADQVGPQPLEQGARALLPLHGAQDLQRLGEVEEARAQGVGRGGGVGGARGAELGLVEVGLEAGFEDVEGGGEGRGCHAADSIQVVLRK